MPFVYTVEVVFMAWILAGKYKISLNEPEVLIMIDSYYFLCVDEIVKIFIFSRIDSKEKRQLIQEYMSADANRKYDLEKRYGRIQMQRMVDTLLDDQYLRDNASKCPNCNTFIQKTEGCNKMTCLK